MRKTFFHVMIAGALFWGWGPVREIPRPRQPDLLPGPGRPRQQRSRRRGAGAGTFCRDARDGDTGWRECFAYMAGEEKRALIACFSWSGNTEALAELIQEQTGGDLYKITTQRHIRRITMRCWLRLRRNRRQTPGRN